MRASLEKRNQRAYYLFLVPGLVYFSLVIIIPFITNFMISFTEWSGIGTPKFIGFANYIKAVKDKAFWISFQNNLLLIIAMTIIPTIIGILLAVLLFDVVAKGIGQTVASFFRAGFYLPQVITIVVSAYTWKWLYQPNWGAVNWMLKALKMEPVNWLGNPKIAMFSIMAMMVWFQIGYPLVIFMSALQRIDPQLYESAAIDGAGWWSSLFNITIPQIMAEIYVVVLTTMIHALKIFDPVYAMTRGGPGHATSVAGYFSFKNFFERARVGYGSAVAMILSLLLIVVAGIFLLVQSRREHAV
jgi:raffinose/stachyose/melibiose transport system permease protein